MDGIVDGLRIKTFLIALAIVSSFRIKVVSMPALDTKMLHWVFDENPFPRSKHKSGGYNIEKSFCSM